MGGYKLIYVTEGHPEHCIGPVNPDKAAGADVRFDWKTGRGSSTVYRLQFLGHPVEPYAALATGWSCF
jgi:hypothetical protein